MVAKVARTGGRIVNKVINAIAILGLIIGILFLFSGATQEILIGGLR